jgi:hypothetical protein
MIISMQLSRAYPKIIFIGNFLHETMKTIGPSAEIADKLAKMGWKVITTANKQNKIKRPFKKVLEAYCYRSSYDIAHVDVYSGPAFFWAEAAVWTLTLLGKPYVLTLQGGNLSAFARHSVRQIREWRSHLDVMLIRGPTPLLAGDAGAAGGLPLVLLLVMDL